MSSSLISRKKTTILFICCLVFLIVLPTCFLLYYLGLVSPIITVIFTTLVESAGFMINIVSLLASLGVQLKVIHVKALLSKIDLLPGALISVAVAALLIRFILVLSILTSDPYIHRGTLVLNDALIDNNSGYEWEQDNSQSHSTSICTFSDGGYTVSDSTKRTSLKPEPITYCQARNTSFKHFIYEVQMTFIKGDMGGIRFFDGNENAFYFGLKQDGEYYFYEFKYPDYATDVGEGSDSSALVTHGNVGRLPQTDTMAVIVTGDNEVGLYVNRHKVPGGSGDAFVTVVGYCQIGVFVRRMNSPEPTTVKFNNAKVWQLG